MSIATLYMPDISGFTKFLKETEQAHSRHIISELIKLIIKIGSKHFEVAEIEGDAVFFYKEEKLGVDSIMEISKEIHARFHTHLDQYDHKRLCECGACTTAADLGIKFIVHAGEIGLIDYNEGAKKPFGQSVIEVHRLLKTKIGKKEYLLFSDNYLKGEPVRDLIQGEYVDRELGPIPFKFQEIEDWEPQTILENQNDNSGYDLIVTDQIELGCDPADLHEMLVNFKYRHLWNKGVDKIIYDEEEINQVGTEHYCIINGSELHFDSVKPKTAAGQLAYGEILKNPGPFGFMEINFFLEEIEDFTMLTQIIKVRYKSKAQSLLKYVFKRILQKQLKKGLRDIQEAIPAFYELREEKQLVNH